MKPFLCPFIPQCELDSSTRYFSPRGDCFPGACVIDQVGPGSSLAGRGAGYKTRLHCSQAGSGLARTPGTPHPLQMVSSVSSLALLQSPGPGVCLPVAGFLPPPFSYLAARCFTSHVVLKLCLATTRQPVADTEKCPF